MNATAWGQFRIIDLSTYIAGPFCTKLFADYGADVIKVEPPGCGDEARRAGPFFRDDPHPEKSLLFLYLNCNKRGLTLDIRTVAGKKILLELIKSADALIESYPPGYLAKLGLGYEDLARTNPRLVMTSITPFGQTGPFRDYAANDLTLHAMGGVMYTSGAYDREPLSHGHPQALYVGGITAAYATAAALFYQAMSGQGQHVDLSLREVMAVHHRAIAMRYSYSGAIERRAPKDESGSAKGTRFEGIVPVKDGYMSPSVQRGSRPTTFAEFAQLIGRPDIDDPKFATRAGRSRHAKELDEVVLPALQEWNKFDLFNAAMADGWVIGVVQTSEDLAKCPQLGDRGFYAEVEHPVIGKIKVPGEVFRFPESPWNLRSPAPLLGQHNEAVYCGDLGYSKQELVMLRQMGAI